MCCKLAKVICLVFLLGAGSPRAVGIAERTSFVGPNPAPPVAPEGYIPATDVCKALSSSWEWDPLLGRFEIILPSGKRLVLLVDSNRVGYGDQLFHIKNPVRFLKNRLFVPDSLVTDILESTLGYTVEIPTPTPEPVPLLPTPFPTPSIDFGPIALPPGLRPTPNIEEVAIPPPEETPIRHPVVVLDPGHGGEDTGSVGVGSTTEADIVLAIAQRCEQSIQDAFDIDVSLTRRENRYLSTLDRVAFANSLGASAFVSLHAGSLFDPTLSLPSVFFLVPPADEGFSGGDEGSVRWWEPSTAQPSLVPWRLGSAAWFKESRDLADSLHQALVINYKDFQHVVFDDGPRQARLAILRGLLMPGALVELGSLSNIDAEQILTKEGFQRRMGDSLALAIGNWIYRREGRPPRDSLVP